MQPAQPSLADTDRLASPIGTTLDRTAKDFADVGTEAGETSVDLALFVGKLLPALLETLDVSL